MLFTLALFSCGAPSTTNSEPAPVEETVEDYLSVPGPLEFHKTSFELTSSEISSERYCTQIYLPKGESLESFNQKMSIELWIPLEVISAEIASGSKTYELDERKKSDPECNYRLTKSPDGSECMIEYFVSEKGSSDFIEFNLAHYSRIMLDETSPAIRIMTYTTRGYADEIPGFMAKFDEERAPMFHEMTGMKKPDILIGE